VLEPHGVGRDSHKFTQLTSESPASCSGCHAPVPRYIQKARLTASCNRGPTRFVDRLLVRIEKRTVQYSLLSLINNGRAWEAPDAGARFSQ
jgi:hypothetical protein